MIAPVLALLDRLSARSDALFVELTYRIVLGRPADPGALANCVAKLRAGYARRSLVQDLVASEEFADKVRAARADTDVKEYDVFGTRLVLHDVRVVAGERLGHEGGKTAHQQSRNNIDGNSLP